LHRGGRCRTKSEPVTADKRAGDWQTHVRLMAQATVLLVFPDILALLNF
jgi:hypothetical protein